MRTATNKTTIKPGSLRFLFVAALLFVFFLGGKEACRIELQLCNCKNKGKRLLLTLPKVDKKHTRMVTN